ncbi:MAG: hypothetical protein ABW128_16440 [Rhizorhabdus sp.]
MREILPEAAPGKTLEEVMSAQLIQMIVARHSERAVHEHTLADDFISDGCSLQEWIYGSVRVKHGVNPNSSVSLSPDETVQKTLELSYFKDVMLEPGKPFKRHVSSSFDMFIHLSSALSVQVEEWMLKQVQHDEGKENMITPPPPASPACRG